MIIDFHVHTFPAEISEKVLMKLSKASHTKYFTNGSRQNLLSSMNDASVTYSVNLPVMTRVDQVEKINHTLISEREKLFEQGIITFGGMHPDYTDYKAELKRLKENGIKGIKIHPAYQNTDLDDTRFLRIIDYASGLGLIVLTHAGIDIGIYDHNYASVSHILHVLDTVHPDKFVLAHMGNWACWKEVEQDLAGADVWFDTAFAIGPVTQDDAKSGTPYIACNLSDEQFVRIVRKHGADKILFATDSPWEGQKDYIERMERMPLSIQEKKKIFSENAVRLLQLSF